MIRFLVIMLFSSSLFAATITQVPAPSVSGIPTNASYTSECVGVSDAGDVVCNFKFVWTYLRSTKSQSVGAIYSQGVSSALAPPAGKTNTKVLGITHGGFPFGGSDGYATVWPSPATPIYIALGEVLGANDSGQYALGGTLQAINTQGQTIGEHSLVDASGVLYGAARAANKMALSDTGVAVWSTNYGASDVIGFRVSASGAERFEGIPLKAVDASGDAVGGDKIVRAGGAIEVVNSQSGYSAIDLQGIAGQKIVGSGLTAFAGRRGIIYGP